MWGLTSAECSLDLDRAFVNTLDLEEIRMSISPDLQEALQSLHAHAARYHRFKEDPQVFLDDLPRLGTERLQTRNRSAPP